MVGHDMVSTGPSVANRYQLSQETYRASSQPADFREGLTSALNVVKDVSVILFLYRDYFCE